MTIACQPNLSKAESTFNIKLKVTEAYLNLLKQSPESYIPGETFNVPQIPGLSLQPLFAVVPQPGEGQKFVVGLRVNNNSVNKTAMFPFQMNYSVNIESGNFSRRYSAPSVPVNPATDVDTFDALVMKVFNFNEVYDRKNRFINNGEICVTVSGNIHT